MIGIARELVAPVVDHPLESSLPRSGPSWQVYEAPGAQQLPRTPVPTA
jgi:hypothetical protein